MPLPMLKDQVRRDPKKVNQSELTQALQCGHSRPLLNAQVAFWHHNYAFISSHPRIGCGELQNIANMSKDVKTYPKKDIPLLY